MDVQDQNTPAVVPSAVVSVAPSDVPSITPSPPATPFSGVPSPVYNPQQIVTEGNVQAVPQEGVGFAANSSVPDKGEPAVGADENRPDQFRTAEVFPEAVSSVVPETPAQAVPEPAPDITLETVPEVVSEPQAPPVPQTPQVDGAASSQEEPPAAAQKTPLEILEEILADANVGDGDPPPSESSASGPDSHPGQPGEAEQYGPSEAEKQQQAEEEARRAAERAAEEQRYQQEVQQRLALAQKDIQEAGQYREQVEQQLHEQGKQTGPMPGDAQDQQLEIVQLQHDTLSNS